MEGWIVLLCLGLIMMIVAMPLSGKDGGGGKTGGAGMNGGNLEKAGVGKEGSGEAVEDNSLEGCPVRRRLGRRIWQVHRGQGIFLVHRRNRGKKGWAGAIRLLLMRLFWKTG